MLYFPSQKFVPNFPSDIRWRQIFTRKYINTFAEYRFNVLEGLLYQKSAKPPPPNNDKGGEGCIRKFSVGGDKVRFLTFKTHFQQIMH